MLTYAHADVVSISHSVVSMLKISVYALALGVVCAFGARSPQQPYNASSLANDGDLHPGYAVQSRELLKKYPLVDTHIDLSATMRTIHRKPMDALPKLNVSHPGHFDLPRARQGGLSGAFFTANAPCPAACGSFGGAL